MLPGRRGSVDQETAQKLGLDYAFGHGAVVSRPVTQSPAGGAGCVFADARRLGNNETGYYPDRQKWRKMPAVGNRPELWIGFFDDDPPDPSDLARQTLLPGTPIRLGEYTWQIPEVARYDEINERWASVLPAYLDYDSEGNVIRGEPLEEYQRLWDECCKVAEASMKGDFSAIDDNDVTRTVIALLHANYVVDLPELAMMRALIDTNDLALVVQAAVQLDKLLEWARLLQKKSDALPTGSGSTTNDGEAA